MAAALHDLLSRDHERLDALLTDCLQPDGTIDMEPYGEFRRGLLRHIGIEEKILFPEVRRRRGDSDVERQLHRDHAVLAALLVPPPTAKEIALIRKILEQHNPLEEDQGGLYEVFEDLAGDDLDDLMERVRSYPVVRVSPHSDSTTLRSSLEQLLREAEQGRRALHEGKR
jgi:hemerythrin superfamily protein